MSDKPEFQRVLIVDDEPNVALILAEGLKKLGKAYLVETAHSGAEALARLRQSDYTLIITDYRMPGMSGVELAQFVRQQAPQTQVMLMTGYGSEGLHDVVGSLKLDGYIDKPVTTARIREIVRHAVDQTSQEKDPYRAAERTLEISVTEHLQTLQINANARCVLLLTSSGYAVETVGQTSSLDVSSVSALVAANFIAAAELARLLGNDSVFKCSHHEGPNYDIYAHDVTGEFLLAVIFGSESKTGIVRFYTNEAVTALVPVLAGIAVNGPLPDDFSTAVDSELAHLFDTF